MTWPESHPYLAMLIPMATAAAALIGQAIAYVRRRSEARWLEQMKADIRRDVEESLKAQETRLRVGADLQLRLHEKSWSLLRELLDAIFASQDKILRFAVDAANPAADRAQLLPVHDEIHVQVLKLAILAHTAPPQINFGRTVTLIRQASSGARALLYAERRPAEVAATLKAIQDQLNQGVEAAGTLTEEWNAKLWLAMEQLPTSLAIAQPPLVGSRRDDR